MFNGNLRSGEHCDRTVTPVKLTYAVMPLGRWSPRSRDSFPLRCVRRNIDRDFIFREG